MGAIVLSSLDERDPKFNAAGWVTGKAGGRSQKK
jgi:hypothetical protein